jgi:hypothetical protein
MVRSLQGAMRRTTSAFFRSFCISEKKRFNSNLNMFIITNESILSFVTWKVRQSSTLLHHRSNNNTEKTLFLLLGSKNSMTRYRKRLQRLPNVVNQNKKLFIFHDDNNANNNQDNKVAEKSLTTK